MPVKAVELKAALVSVPVSVSVVSTTAKYNMYFSTLNAWYQFKL